MNFVDANANQAAGVNQAAGGGAEAQGAGGGAGARDGGKPAAQQEGAAEGSGRLRKWVCAGLAVVVIAGVALFFYVVKKGQASAQTSGQQAAAQGAGQANGRGVLGAGGADAKGEELTDSALSLLRKEGEAAQEGQAQKAAAGGDAQGADQQKPGSLDGPGAQGLKQGTGGGFGGAMSFRDTSFDAKPAGGGGGAVPAAGTQADAADESKVEGAGSRAQGRASVPDDVSVRYAPVPGAARVSAATPAATREGVAGASPGGAKAVGVVPPFGSKVEVEVAGAFFAPASEGSLVVMRVKADAGGEGWSLPRGTLVVGRVKGVVANSRVDVAAFGYLENNKLVRFSGVLLDENEAAGLPGEVKNKDGLLKRFGRAALRGVSGLPYAYRGIPYGVIPDVQGASVQSGENRTYVMVEAGVAGVVFVTGLPSEAEVREAEPGSPAALTMGELSPQEMELLKQLRGQGSARR